MNIQAILNDFYEVGLTINQMRQKYNLTDEQVHALWYASNLSITEIADRLALLQDGMTGNQIRTVMTK